LPKTVAPPDGVLRFFEGHEGPHRYLSNHYVGKTTWRFVLPACCRRGIASERATGVSGWALSSDVWSAESAVMLCKAAIMVDLDSYRALQHVRDPGEAKRIGCAVGQRRGTWDDAKWVALHDQVAQSIVDQKFASCLDAASVLLDTGDLLLAETNPNDRVWGVGLSSSDPRVGTPSSWPVSPQLCNLLGRCLMVVRSRLRSRRQPAGPGQSATARHVRLLLRRRWLCGRALWNLPIRESTVRDFGSARSGPARPGATPQDAPWLRGPSLKKNKSK
jgi:ribA/ribD-fused uncharacterized protein